ncbi:MAG: septum formation inhibitor Maf [Gammaproteobacteria bacterium]|nr:septum formation inhibitor Maf [Gammaproteobacteria bacterium]MCP5299626.1 septum formation inhibitor Maf [Chromatiaceae bacterium]
MHLVLASTSPYRAALLEKLAIPFAADAPETDESQRDGEDAASLVKRLSAAKARAVGARHPNALVIGSDQVATIGAQVLGKPGDRERAIEQLCRASGRAVVFYTGLCLLNTTTGHTQVDVETFTVRFRELGADQIERYVDLEQPFNCAGSFKSEGFGITLFSAFEGRDPNSLVGLPLMRLVEMLAAEGIEIP